MSVTKTLLGAREKMINLLNNSKKKGGIRTEEMARSIRDGIFEVITCLDLAERKKKQITILIIAILFPFQQMLE